MTLAEYRKMLTRLKDEQSHGSRFFKRWQPPKGGIERWFAERGIRPTLAEYREVAACAVRGANPLGIH